MRPGPRANARREPDRMNRQTIQCVSSRGVNQLGRQAQRKSTATVDSIETFLGRAKVSLFARLRGTLAMVLSAVHFGFTGNLPKERQTERNEAQGMKRFCFHDRIVRQPCRLRLAQHHEFLSCEEKHPFADTD